MVYMAGCPWLLWESDHSWRGTPPGFCLIRDQHELVVWCFSRKQGVKSHHSKTTKGIPDSAFATCSAKPGKPKAVFRQSEPRFRPLRLQLVPVQRGKWIR